MRVVSVDILAFCSALTLALNCSSTPKKAAVPEAEGFINSDTLFVRGQGETKTLEKPLSAIMAEYVAREEARIDATRNVPEICRGPVAACGGEIRSTAVGKQLQGEVRGAKPVHTECARLATAEPRYSCVLWFKIQKKGLKQECAETVNMTVASGCGY